MFESLACSALRKEGNSGSESHSRGRPDSTTLMGRDLPPHTYSTIALGGSMHHHGGTLFDSRARREGLRDADGCLSQGCTKGERAYHPSKRLTLRATLEDQARGIRSAYLFIVEDMSFMSALVS